MPKNKGITLEHEEITLECIANMLEVLPHDPLLKAAYDCITQVETLRNEVNNKDSSYFSQLNNFYGYCIREIEFQPKKNDKAAGAKQVLFNNCMKVVIYKLCDYYEEQIVTTDRSNRNGLSGFGKSTGILLRRWSRREKWSKGDNLLALWQVINTNVDSIIERFVSYIADTINNARKKFRNIEIARCEFIDGRIRKIQGQERLKNWTLRDIYLQPSHKRKSRRGSYYGLSVDPSKWLYFFRFKNSQDALLLSELRRPHKIDPREIVREIKRVSI